MFKVGDLVTATTAVDQKIGIIRKVIGIGGSYEILFFDPPNESWSESQWPPYALEKISCSK